MDTECVLDIPRATWQVIDVTERQAVTSHPVFPCRVEPVYATIPMFTASMLKLAEPVPAPFALSTIFHPSASNDKTEVMLPAFTPAVTSIGRVPLVLDPASKHEIDVSECQLVASVAVCPTLESAELGISPMFSPYIVTGNDVICAAFLLLVNAGFRFDMSTEKARLRLPVLSPAVITAC